jgi:copper transport protein
VGNNSIHLYAYAPDGKPQPVAEWSASAALPAAEVEPIDVPLLKITDNHAIGEVQLPSAGQWQLRFTLRTTEIDQASVTAEVPIR